MKKLMNEPGAFVDEMLEGLLLAHPDRLKWVADWQVALPSGMYLAVQPWTRLRPRPAVSTQVKESCTFTVTIPAMC